MIISKEVFSLLFAVSIATTGQRWTELAMRQEAWASITGRLLASFLCLVPLEWRVQGTMSDRAEEGCLDLGLELEQADEVFWELPFPKPSAYLSLPPGLSSRLSEISLGEQATGFQKGKVLFSRSLSVNEPSENEANYASTSDQFRRHQSLDESHSSETPTASHDTFLSQELKESIRSRLQLRLKHQRSDEKLKSNVSSKKRKEFFDEVSHREEVRMRNRMHARQSRERFRKHAEALRETNDRLSETQRNLIDAIGRLEEAQSNLQTIQRNLHRLPSKKNGQESNPSETLPCHVRDILCYEKNGQESNPSETLPCHVRDILCYEKNGQESSPSETLPCHVRDILCYEDLDSESSLNRDAWLSDGAAAMDDLVGNLPLGSNLSASNSSLSTIEPINVIFNTDWGDAS